jgi:hypothetical protein
MASIIIKAVSSLIIVYFLLGASNSIASSYYPSSHIWSFQNQCYLNFNQDILIDTPKKGIFNDSSLVGYWSFNELSSSVVHDSSGNNNDGTIMSGGWVDGKYGGALSFNGITDLVIVEKSPSINLSYITVNLWLKPDSTYGENLPRLIDADSTTGGYLSYLNAANGQLFWSIRNSLGLQSSITSKASLAKNEWTMVTLTYDGIYLKIFLNNILDNSKVVSQELAEGSRIYIGNRASRDRGFNGIVDEVRIYNRALSASEIERICSQQELESFENHYNFKDTNNNTMLIHVDSSIANSDSKALVTCSNFFESNKLTFQANNSAIINVFTTLGKPFFTTGVWNSQNNTITLLLDAYSNAELDWNSGTPPSASNLFLSSTTSSSKTTFTSLWNDDQGLSGGGYVFSTNNTGQWVNASWVPFSFTQSWVNVSLTLNSTVGVVVGFREFANNSLNLWGDSGIYAITTTADQSAPTTNPTQTPLPPSTQTPTPTPTIKPTLQPELSQFPTQTVTIVIILVLMFVVVFGLALKKGYITIEVVDEESTSESQQEDYVI